MPSTGTPATPELVFLPLGGIGEIGLNVYLDGLGPAEDRQWLIVDCGITFPDASEPGVDVVLPDLRFIEEERKSLAGILITHAHEDHIGAVAEEWPRLRAPVYVTKFAARLLKRKLQEQSHGSEVPVVEMAQGSRFNIGPFDVDLVSVAHSIPECNAIYLRTPAGNVLHTADGSSTNASLWRSFRRGEVRPLRRGRGPRACLRQHKCALEGISHTEQDVAENLKQSSAA